MEEHQELNDRERTEGFSLTGMNRWLLIAIVGLLAIAGIALGYGYRQQVLAEHLSAQETAARASMSQMQDQVGTLTAKLNEMAAAQQAAAEAAAQKKVKQATGNTGTTSSKRLKELQGRIDDQQKQLKETQEEVAKNRTDLEGSLNSTKDELNGSIARTHEELVVLQKRGERNYFEFDLTKSKQFQRIGPLTLSLRRVDAKHKNYDLQLIIEDSQVSKKRVNVYEPIWIHMENEGQPVQVVVNKVERNFVHGYVSAPKYRPAELAASGAASVTPVSVKTPSTEPNPPNPQQQPEQPQSQTPQPQTPQPPIPQPPQPEL